MSKGSSPRPFSVSQQEYDDRWDAIFNRPTQREVDEAKQVDDTAINAYNNERLVSNMDKKQLSEENKTV